MFSFWPLTCTVSIFSNFPENVLSLPNPTSHMETSEHCRPRHTFSIRMTGCPLFSFLLNGHNHLTLIALGLLLCIITYPLVSYFIFFVCAYAPFFQPQCKPPRAKSFLPFPWIPRHRARHPARRCVLTCCRGDADALVGTRGDIKWTQD